jgi:hypothetical protein
MPNLPGGGSAPQGSGNLPGVEGEPGQPGSQDPNAKAKKGQVVRTEFIILFLWKEPTPSDALLPPEEAPASPAGGMPMMPAGRGSMPAPGS